MPSRSTSVDHRAELNFDAHLFQPRGGPLAELVAKWRQHRGGGVEQDDAGPGGVDVAEGALQGVIGQFGDLAGHLDAGRSGTDDGEREQLFPPLRIVGPFGRFECAEDASPQFQCVVDGLHTRGEFGELVVAEVGLPGTGSDDQAVVGGFVAMAQQVRHNDFPGQVDMCDVTEQHLDVALSAQDHAGGRSDLALGDDAGRNLVQKRLEQVMSGTGDQLDVDIGPLELFDRVQPAEPGSDDHNPVPTIGCSGFGLGAHGVDCSSTGGGLLRVN